MATRYVIANGPGLLELLFSLSDKENWEGRKRVKFDLVGEKKSTTALVFINGMTREDGSGENWTITGYRLGGTPPSVRGFYSTKTRKGFLDINE